MSATVYELIGQIINPRPMSIAVAMRAVRPVAPAEPVELLIGRIIGSHDTVRKTLEIERPA